MIKLTEAMRNEPRDYAKFDGKKLGEFDPDLAAKIKDTVDFKHFQSPAKKNPPLVKDSGLN